MAKKHTQEIEYKVLNQEFKQGVSEITKEITSLNKEFRKEREEMKLTASESQKLEHNIKNLETRYEKQQEITKKTRDAYEQTVKLMGENSKEAQSLKNKLADSERMEAMFKNKLIEANREIENQRNKMRKLGQQLQDTGAKLKQYGGNIERFGQSMSKGVTAPILALGAVSKVAWNEVDEAYDGIVTATGATGEALEGLKESFDNVASNTPEELGQVSKAIGEINTRFGFTNKILESAADDFLKFARINKIDVQEGVALVSRAMGDAGIESGEYKKVLEQLTVASQSSGIEIGKLTESLTKYGAPMRALGLSTEESIAIFAGWEKAGVNTEIAFSGMKQAIGKWSKEGKDARVEFKKTLKSIEKAPSIAEATTMAIEVFGQKAGPDLADAIQGGRFEFEEFLSIIEGSNGVIEETYGNITDESDEFKKQLNELKLAGHELWESVQRVGAPILKDFTEVLKDGVEWFKQLNPQQQEAIVKFGAMAAAIGPLAIVGGKVVQGLGSMSHGLGTIVKHLSKTKAIEAGTAALGPGAGLSGVLAGLGPIALGVAAGLGAIYIAQKDITNSGDVLVDTFKNLSDNTVGVDGRIDSIAQSVQHLAFATDSEKEAIDGFGTKISETQGKIEEIYSAAAEETRELTEEERKNVEDLIGLLSEYIDEKRRAYMEQQGNLRAMIMAEGEMNQAQAEQFIGQSKGIRDQALQTIDETYQEEINTIREKHTQQGTLNSQAYQEELQNAKEHRDAMREQTSLDFAETITMIEGNNLTQKTLQEQLNQDIGALFEQQKQAYKDLAAAEDEASKHKSDSITGGIAATGKYHAEIDRINKQIAESLNQLNDDELAYWMESIALTVVNGGTLTTEQQKTVDAMFGALDKLPPGTKQRITDALDGAIAAAADGNPHLKARGDQWKNNLLSGMGGAKKEAYNKGRGIGISAKSGAGSVSLYGAGQDAASGFAGGIDSGAGWATSAAHRLASGVLARMRATLRSHSPSRAAMEIGGDTVDGYVIPIEEGEEKAKKSAEKLSKAALVGLKPTVNADITNRQINTPGAQVTVANMTVRKESDIDMIAYRLEQYRRRRS